MAIPAGYKMGSTPGVLVRSTPSSTQIYRQASQMSKRIEKLEQQQEKIIELLEVILKKLPE